MTTGFGNEQAKDAVRRTLNGGSSGRLAVLIIALAFFALGIVSGSLLLSVPTGIIAILAAWAVIRAAGHNRAVRHLERRGCGS